MALFGFGGGASESKGIPEDVAKSDFELKLEEAFALYDEAGEDQSKIDQVEAMLKEAGALLAQQLKANSNSIVIGGEQISYIPEKIRENPTEPYSENKHMETGTYPKFDEFEGSITKLFPEDKKWMVRITAETAIEAMKE